MNKFVIAVIGLIVLLVFASTSFYTVDERQIAVVYTFGKFEYAENAPKEQDIGVQVSDVAASAQVDGQLLQASVDNISTIENADNDLGRGGLFFKWPSPFQTVSYIDKRIQTLDDATPREILTSESNMGLVVDWFVKWQVINAQRFVQTNNGTDMRTAEMKLISNIQRIFNEEVARRSVQAVLDNDRLEIMEAVLTGIDPIARDMGVRIVDVRMRRVDYSASTAPKIFEQMITERKSLAAKLRAEGNAEKEKIRAAADYKYRVEVAQAYGSAQKTMGEGDAEVTRLFGEAFGTDPEFADFYRSLQAYRGSFKDKSDIMILDPNGDFFKFMQSDSYDTLAPTAEGLE